MHSSGKSSADPQILCEDDLRRRLGCENAPCARELLPLLSESHPIYRDAGAPQVERMRGALLLALGRDQMPAEALPFVLEELENAHDAYLTAAAAHALRSFPSPNAAFVEPLLSALLYMRQRDSPVRLSSYGGYGTDGDSTTAMAEILGTLAWLGRAGRAALPRLRALQAEGLHGRVGAAVGDAMERIESAPETAASSCCANRSSVVAARRTEPLDHQAIELEDQDGARLGFAEFFVGKPTIVVFFYTRCENPAKCPRTIARLGELQRTLRREGLWDRLRTAAITYDPEFDSPERLEQFRRSWGAESGPDHRLLRTIRGFDALSSYFELGVNYVSSVVNRHRLETLLLDRSGQIAFAASRTHCNHDDLIERARSLLER